MKTTIDFGLVNAEGKGKLNRVNVNMELRYKDDGKVVFAASAEVWDYRHHDIIHGGQCLDTISKYLTRSPKYPLFKEIMGYWELYHLNDMHPECEHQRELGWCEQANEKITLYHYTLTSEASACKKQAEEAALNALQKGYSFVPTKEQSMYANLNNFIKLYETPEPPEHYVLCKTYIGTNEGKETKRRGWVRYDESELGILCKPCPVCGCKYGTKWLYEPIPNDVLNRITQIIEDNNVK